MGGPRFTRLRKLGPPTLRFFTPRARLYRELDRARARPIVWLTGPAGAGKTTLLASYLADRGEPVVWYAVDARDDDPATFFRYFPHAVERAVGDGGATALELPSFDPSVLPTLASFARTYFEALYSQLDPPVVLVFDDLETLSDGAPWWTLFTAGICAVPSKVSILAASRELPPPPLARPRANSEVVVVGNDDLRFTLEETRALVRADASLDGLDEGDVAQLHARAEGWAAGMVLLLERARSTGRVDATAGELTRSVFSDYFTREVLAHLDPSLRSLLLRSGVLPSFSREELRVVTGQRDLTELFERIGAFGFLSARDDGDEPVYRYHDLFRAVLVERGRREMGGRAWRGLCRRATALLLDGERWEEAFQVAQEAPLWDLAGEVVKRHAPSLLAQGQLLTLADWMDALPGDLLRADTWLCYWDAVVGLHQLDPAAPAALEALVGRFADAGDAVGAYSAWSDVALGWLIRGAFPEPGRAVDHLAQLAALQRSLPSPGPELSRLAGAVAFVLIVATLGPRHPGFEDYRASAETYVLSDSDPLRRGLVGGWLMLFFGILQNDLVSARRTLQALEQSGPPGPPIFRSHLRFMAVSLPFLEGDLEGCLRQARETLARSARTDEHHWDVHALALAHHAAACLGHREAEDGFLDQMAKAARSGRLESKGPYHQCACWTALARGWWIEARRHGQLSWDVAKAVGTVIHDARLAASLACVDFELGERDRAREGILRARRRADEIGDRNSAFLCHLLEADFALREGKDPGESIRRGLALARRHGIVVTTMWRRDVAARVLTAAVQQGIETEYALRLIERHRLAPDPPALHVERWPYPCRIWTLGDFRVAVEGQLLTEPGKAPSRPFELLQAVAALGGRGVPVWRLADGLWPNADGDTAQRRLDVTLHRLRNKLDRPDALVLEDGRLSLAEGICWLDVWAFEDAAAQLQTALAESPVALDRAVDWGDRLLAHYGGELLPCRPAASWAVSPRQSLHRRFRRCVDALGLALERADRVSPALSLYERAIQRDPLAESFYQGLMRGYAAQNHRQQALDAFEACRSALAAAGRSPSTVTRSLLMTIRHADQP